MLGVTYGGDGITTFSLPDLRARTVIGAGPSALVGMVAQLPPGAAAATLDEHGNFVYEVGETAGASDFMLDAESLGEHGFEVIPEPTTNFLAALAGLVGLVRRRKRSTADSGEWCI